MNQHTVQVGYDDATNKHYACIIDSVTGEELYKSSPCRDVSEALRLVYTNTGTDHVKPVLPTSSEKNFPLPSTTPSDKQFCSG
jgi:hypothetical protein